MPVSLASSRQLFPLRVKYGKVTIFVPVQASTTLPELKEEVLKSLVSTRQAPPAGVADSFSELDAQKDIAFFNGGEAGSGTGADAAAGSTGVAAGMTFENVEERSGKDLTVGKVGWKADINSVTYLGFRHKGAASISKPQVQIPSFLDDEEDEGGDEMDIAIPQYNEAGEEIG